MPNEKPMIFNAEKCKYSNEERRIFKTFEDKSALIALWNQGHTSQEIAIAFGCSTMPVKRVLMEFRLRRPAKRRPGKGVGSDNPAWKGGKRIRKDGYILRWTPYGERLEHQLVMEEKLGRGMKVGEVIHHIDGNKQNNNISNLELTTPSEHIRIHLPDMHKARFKKKKILLGFAI